MKKSRIGYISQSFGMFNAHYVTRVGGSVYKKSFRTRLEARAFLSGKPTPTTHDIIKYHMRQNEKEVLAYIRKLNRSDVGYSSFLASSAWSNALDRLKGMRKVVYSKSLGGYVIKKGK